MAIDWTPIEEGDGLDGDSINSRLDLIVSGVNRIEEDSIESESLGRNHIKSIVIESHTSEDSSGTTSLFTTLNANFPGWPDDNAPAGTSPTFDAIPSLELDHPASAVTRTWKGLTYVTFDEPVDLSEVSGILVLANANVTEMDVVGQLTAVGSLATCHAYGFFMIVLKGDDGFYWPVARTLRQIDSETNTNNDNHVSTAEAADYLIPGGAGPTGKEVSLIKEVYKDVAIRAFIADQDLEGPPAASTKFTEVHIVACVLNNSYTYPTADVTMVVQERSLTALVLHSALEARDHNRYTF